MSRHRPPKNPSRSSGTLIRVLSVVACLAAMVGVTRAVPNSPISALIAPSVAKAAAKVDNVETLAGGRTASDNGVSATNARMSDIAGIASTAYGTLVADPNQNRILLYPPTGISGTFLGINLSNYGGDMVVVAGSQSGAAGTPTYNGESALSAILDGPQSIAVDSSNDLLIADSGAGLILLVANGTTSPYTGTQSLVKGGVYTLAGGGTSSFTNGMSPLNAKIDDPSGITTKSPTDDSIYFSATGDNHVLEVPVSSGSQWNISMTAGDLYDVLGKANGSAGSSGDNGAGTSAYLSQPMGLAFGASGHLFVADYGNCRLQELSATSHSQFGISMSINDAYTVAGSASPNCGYSGDGGPTTSSLLNQPWGVAVQTGGNVYVSMAGGSRVRELVGTSGTSWGASRTANDIYTVVGGSTIGFSGDGGAPASAKIAYPEGVALDGGGNLIVADSQNLRLRTVTPGPTPSSAISTTGGSGYSLITYGNGTPGVNAWLQGPDDSIVTNAGDTIIADYNNNRIQFIAGKATPSGQSGPFGLSPITSSQVGEVFTIAGDANGVAGNDSTHLSEPDSIAQAPDGSLYIGDNGNCEIRKLSPSGTLSVFAGGICGASTGTGGMNPTLMQLGRQLSVYVDPNNNVYFSDGWNGQVWVVASGTSVPLVSGATVAGDAYRVAGYSNASTGYNTSGGSAASSGLLDPTALAEDQSGNLYIADYSRIEVIGAANNSVPLLSSSSALDMYDLAGSNSGSMGTSTLPVADSSLQLNNAQGLAVSPNGDVYVANTSGNDILELAGSNGEQWGQSMVKGTAYRVAGTGTGGYSASGTVATNAGFLDPNSVSVDPNTGNLVVADTGNSQIRTVDASDIQSCGNRYDPTLLQNKVLDSNGAPVTGNQNLVITAQPIDTTDWPAATPYPTVGTGYSDADGYIETCLDSLATSGVQNDPRFQTENGGTYTLDVYYKDSSGNLNLGATIPYSTGSYYDPILLQQPLGQGTVYTAQAQPQYTDSWPTGSASLQIGSGTTGSGGNIQSSLDLSQVLGNAAYAGDNGTATLTVSYVDGNGNSHYVPLLDYLYDGYDPTVQAQQLTDPSGNPIVAGTSVQVRIEPVSGSGPDQVIGNGVTDDNGDPNVILNPNAYINNPAYVTGGSATLNIYYQSSGSWVLGGTVSDDWSTSVDPIVQEQQIMVSGNPMANTPILIRAEPAAGATPGTSSYPQVGVGTTDSSGDVDAVLGIGSLLGNSTYDPSNQDMTFDIFYQDSTGAWDYSQSVTEYVGGNVDPTLAQAVLTDSSSNPVVNSDVAIKIEPASGATPGTSSYPQVGTGVTDTNGNIYAGLNLSSYQQNSQYDANNVMTVDVYTQNSSGNLTFVQAVPYSSPNYDPVLQTKVILDSSNTPIANATVRVMSDPIVSTGSPSPVQIGTGTTDGLGHVYAAVDPTPVVNNPAYQTDNSVLQLEVDYQTSPNGSWTEAFSYPEYMGGDNDPVLMTKQIIANGSPVSGASVQVFAVPVGNTGSNLTGDPVVSTGTTAPDGTLHIAPLDLTGVQQTQQATTPYEDGNGDIQLVVQYDGCATGTDSSSNCTANPPTPDWQTATFPSVDPLPAHNGVIVNNSIITEYFGTGYDAVLAQQQALDSNGIPIENQNVNVTLNAIDGSSPNVTLGTGTTNASGYVIAPVNAVSYQASTAYQNQDNLNVNLTVSTSSSGSLYTKDAAATSSDAVASSPQQNLNAVEPLNTGGTTCDTTEDPSAYSATMASACGQTVYPLNHTQGEAGGGTDYVYYEQGLEVGEIMPPSDFDPLSASTQQLQMFGYPMPPSPSETTAYSAWEREMSGASPAQTPTFDSESALTSSQSVTEVGQEIGNQPACTYSHRGTVYSLCWTGLVATEKSGTADFTSAAMQYTEPNWTMDSACSQTYPGQGAASTWVGIGPYQLVGLTPGTLALGQDGTQPVFGKNGLVPNKSEFWWQIVSYKLWNSAHPDQSKTPVRFRFKGRNVPLISAGALVNVETNIDPSQERYDFTVFSNERAYSYYVRPWLHAEETFDESQAEYVLERAPSPSSDGYLLGHDPLLKFSTSGNPWWNVAHVMANGHTKTDAAGASPYFEDNYNLQRLQVQNESDIKKGNLHDYLATIATDGSSDGFYVAYRHCQ